MRGLIVRYRIKKKVKFIILETNNLKSIHPLRAIAIILTALKYNKTTKVQTKRKAANPTAFKKEML